MLQQFERDYWKLIKEILDFGVIKQTRNSKTKSLFGKTLEVDLSKSNAFPLLQGRKSFYKGVLGELAAFVRGPKNIKDFEKFNCNYWKKWAKENGDITIDYGNLWINWNGVDQLQTVIDTLRNNPNDRRIIISSWDPSRLDKLSLPCCHLLYQFYSRPEQNQKYLDMIWYQRSVDTMIGLPADIILAATLNILLANETGHKPGKITMVLGDTHIYESHYEKAEEYLKMAKRAENHTQSTPIFDLDTKASIKQFIPSDLTIIGYEPYHSISFELIV